MKTLKQSQTAEPLVFLLVLTSDHISPATGKSPTVTISKNGAAFASPSGAVTEIGSGWYKVAGNATDTNTLGPLLLHATEASSDPSDEHYQIIAWDTEDAVRGGLTALPNAAAEAAGGLYTRGAGAGQINQPANGQIDANTVKLSGTSQTARDIGASVLLSAGSGAGQLDFTSGVVKSSLTQILGTALTETAGQIAGGFKKFFNVAAPVLDTTSVNQTGDAYARLGLPAGASVSADVAAVKGDTAGIKTKTDSLTFTGAGKVDSSLRDWLGTAPNALVQGRVDAIKQVRTGTAQAGAAGTITLDAGANASNDYYKDDHVVILAGTGSGQTREIASYVGATKVATITPNWITNPDNTSVFALLPMAMVDAAATVSGNVTVGGYAAGQDPATLVLVTPANKLATDVSGRIDLGKWIGSAPDALSSGKIPADLKLWLAAAPASLTASGYVQSMLLRWLTDNAGGTPNALVVNRVDASAGAVADKTGYTVSTVQDKTGYTVSTVQDKTGYTVSTVQDKTGYSLSAAGVQAIWDALTSALVTVNSIGSLLTTNINAAINSRMATFSLPTNFSSLAIDASGRIDLGKWLGSVPAALSGVAGYVQTMLRRWLTDDASGTPLALSTNLVQSTGGGGGGGGTIYGSSGSIAYTYTVTKPGGSLPLAGATVWVSSDVAGVNRSQAQISDALGRVQFNLDPSTVYFWRRHSDWVFVDPDSQLIS